MNASTVVFWGGNLAAHFGFAYLYAKYAENNQQATGDSMMLAAGVTQVGVVGALNAMYFEMAWLPALGWSLATGAVLGMILAVATAGFGLMHYPLAWAFLLLREKIFGKVAYP